MTTIINAAIAVLKKANKALSADEIYIAICKDNLFQFGAKDPRAILRAQLRKYSVGFTGKSAAKNPRFKQLPDKKFHIIF